MHLPLSSYQQFIHYRFIYWVISLLLCWSPLTQALTSASSNAFPPTQEEFLPLDEAYQLSVRQTQQQVIVEWIIAEHYFLYGEQFAFHVKQHPVAASIAPGKIDYDPIFEKDVEKYYLYTQAVIEKSQLPASTVNLSVSYQGCADAGLCYPPETRHFSLDLSKGTTVKTTTPATTSTPKAPASSFTVTALMLLFALLGGALLNLMPCVFPVLSIKALSLSQNTEALDRIKHGWSYTVGCLITFVTVAIVLLAVRDAGKAVGWGFQLQSPAVITFLGFLFFMMGLTLSGLIQVGGRWMGVGQSLTQGKGLGQSFFTGVLAAIVASPCTAPFMASALGYALTQPTVTALAIFAALGLGMALPFLLLSYLPVLGRYLPSPGPWMDTFKQALAFPLYLTSIWLLWVLGQQIGNNGVILSVLGATGIAFVIWLNQKRPHWAVISKTLMALILVSIIWHNQYTPTTNKASSHGFWQAFSTAKLAELRQQGKPVFVNLTADWCITCKVNEARVFTPQTLQWMQNQGITLLEGDWTNYNPEITGLLDQYGRAGVPLYLLFPATPNAEATILPQILTPSTFKNKIMLF